MSSAWNSDEHPASPFATEVETRWPADGVGISGSPHEAPVFQAFEEAAGPSTPPSVQEILELRHARESLEWGAVRRAVAAGNMDPGRLANLVFLARHPERGVRALSTSEPGYAALAAEREAIRDTIVRPVLAQNPAPAPSAETWVQQTERPANGHDPDGSAWLETGTAGVEGLTGQDPESTVPEYRETTAIVRPWNGGARAPTTSVAAWAALARALLHTSDEAGPGLEEAAGTPGSALAEQTAGEVPYPAGGTASSVESVIIKTEIGKGVTNENVLTDLVFYRRYPARNRRPLSPTEPSFSTLSQEWLRIRDTQVRPLLTAPSPPVGRPYVPAPPAGSPGTPSANVGSFDGKPVASWLIPYLTWARERGWTGAVNSGYRSPEESEKVCIDLCGAPKCKPPNRPCAGRDSNHSGDVKPRGAIDVSDETRFGQLMASCPFSPRIRNNMPTTDPWHYSESGY